jgi:glycosyltransferase involved in cell wall biosynthesis
MRIAYVVGRYPAISHSFILREVQALRDAGVHVSPISIHRTPERELLAVADREEAARTHSVLPPRVGALALAQARALLTRPRGWLSALRAGMQLAQPGLRGRLWQLFYLVEAVGIWDHCRREQVEHLHVHHLNQAADATMMAVAIEGRRSNGRSRWTWSFTLHGPDELLDRSLFRLAAKAESADAIACISDFARSQAMAVLGEDEWGKLEVVHCALDVEQFHRSEPPREPVAGEPLRLLYVGRMVPAKGQAVLLEAVALLRARGVPAAATLIGDGPSRERVRERAEQLGLADVIDAPGPVGQDEIRRHYEAADVFVLPSFAEGVPVVLMEAMALEVPVVTTLVAGVTELVEDGVSGYVVRPGRADLLADAIGRLAADPALRREMGRRGRERVAERFEVHAEAARLRDLFARTIAAAESD